VGATTLLEQERLLEAIGNLAADAAGLPEVLHAAAAAMLRDMADLVIIGLLEPDGGSRVKVAHRDPDREREAVEVLREATASFRRVIAAAGSRHHTFRWIPRVTPTTLRLACRGEQQAAEALHRLNARSIIAVVVESGGQRRGLLVIARTDSDDRYNAHDLAVAQVMARRLATAVESTRLRSTIREVSRSHMRVEGALKKWTRVFDLATWGVALVRPADRRLTAVNPAFVQMHGYAQPDELIERPFPGLMSPDHADELASWPDAPDRFACTYESLHRRPDGRTFPVLVNVTRLDVDHEPDTFVVTVQDLTDLKRAEERLRRAQRMEAVGRLAGGVAHEVNNMMTIILGFSDLLGRAENLPEPLQGDVDEIRKAANRAGKITQQLLAFSRQQVLQPVELRLNSVVEELVPVLRLLIPANVRVQTGLSPVDASVRADRGQLEQVLINLAFNARDAMPQGGTIRIATEARYLSEDAGQRLIGVPFAPGQYGLISVIDTGHGMDEGTLEQLFEPFFTTKPAGMGTGLGLATVYGIVKQSGGYVWAESTPGEGTTFTVGFPLVETSERRDRDSGTRHELGEPAGGTVLVVEDESGVRQLAARVLAAKGYHVLEARNGEEALRALDHAGDVDLVLTDVVVPDLGTGDLARRVREVKEDVPILYMSGYPREDVLQRGLISPDQPFLQKPFTGDGLVDAVGRILLGNPVVGR
jgi:PAS domain S-box-containing protein